MACDETKQGAVALLQDSHKCFVFGPFSMGNHKDIEPYNVTFRYTGPRVFELVGRQKDMYSIISKVMSGSTNLFTMIGLPGVGKSSLAKATMHYIEERSLLKGGAILTDARNIRNCELFVRKLNN